MIGRLMAVLALVLFAAAAVPVFTGLVHADPKPVKGACPPC